MGEAVMVSSAYERTGDLTLYALNCYGEDVETPSGRRVEMRARGGLAEFAEVGSVLDRLRAAHQKDGLFSNASLWLSGTSLYTLTSAGVVTTLSGTVAGTSLAEIDSQLDADLNSIARIANGSALYKYDSSLGTVVAEDFPVGGGPGASSICAHRSFWFASEAGTDKVYFLSPGVAIWDALDFASAEYAADPIVAIRSVGEILALLGSSSFEGWSVGSGTPQPYGGLAFGIGCRSRDTARVIGETLVWVDNLCRVQRFEGGAPDVVSNPGLTEQIAATAAADLSAWTYAQDGHRFYVLQLGDTATWVYDLDGPGDRWTTFSSPSYAYWRPRIGCNIGDTVLAGDVISNAVWTLDATRRMDIDDYFAVEFSAVIPAAEQPQSVANVSVVMDIGDAPRTGQGSSPKISRKFSDSQGKLWSSWRDAALPQTGEYTVLPRWNAEGTIRANFERIYRFRVSDPVGRVFKRVMVNT